MNVSYADLYCRNHLVMSDYSFPPHACVLVFCTQEIGNALEIFVAKKRNNTAAIEFLNKATRLYGNPREIDSDRLRFYPNARKEMRVTRLSN